MSTSAHPAGPAHADSASAALGPAPGDLAFIDPAIWPTSVQRVENELQFAGIPVTKLAQDFGTPSMLLDEADFRARARAYVEAFAGADVYYAGKAFLCTTVARWAAEEGLHLDVCTGGELALALAADFPAERLAMHGNNKSIAELERAITAKIKTIVVDSFTEIDRVAEVAVRLGVVQRVMVRVTVGVEAHTHEFIATAHEDQKFGFSLKDGDALRAVKAICAHNSLKFVGLHSHIGSQIFDTSGFEVAAHRVIGLALEIREQTGIEIEVLNLGGGLGIAYVTGDDPMTPADLGNRLNKIIETECAAASLRKPRLAVEPGRAIVGPTAITLYEVGTVKQVALDSTTRAYISVDGGMSDNIRTALYDASYTVTLASRRSEAGPMLSRVVGKHCESGDIVVRDGWLPADVRPGDLLAVAATGAYCRSLANNYNQVPRPPVVSVKDGQTTVLIRRETEDDLFRTDTGWRS
jgi:diaminopimelate decarboxylase